MTSDPTTGDAADGDGLDEVAAPGQTDQPGQPDRAAAAGDENQAAAEEPAVDWKDTAQRVAAEFDNYRKRVATQQADEVQRATGRLAEALLPVLDACEAAFVQHPAEIEPLFNLLLGELRKAGLEGMNLHGAAFDPNLAEAVLHEPAGADDADVVAAGGPVVAEVLRSGYTWKGRVLRPAMVKVKG